MSYHAKIVNHIEDIDELEWDKLNAGVPFGSLRWVRLALESNPHFQPYFILVYEDSTLVGRAIASFSKEHGMSIPSPVKRMVIDRLLERFPLLQCQAAPYNLISMSGLVLPNGNEAEAMRVINDALKRLGRIRSTSFIALGWLNEVQHHAVERLPLYHTQVYTETVLVNRWANFDEYVSTLGKTARKNFRQHSNHARKMGIRIEETRHFAQYADQLHKLMLNVDNH